jgi:hypothetical protein
MLNRIYLIFSLSISLLMRTFWLYIIHSNLMDWLLSCPVSYHLQKIMFRYYLCWNQVTKNQTSPQTSLAPYNLLFPHDSAKLKQNRTLFTAILIYFIFRQGLPLVCTLNPSHYLFNLFVSYVISKRLSLNISLK